MTPKNAVINCNYCSKEFKYDSERKRHEQSHFPQFQCKVCSKNFSFISALRRHEKQHERTGSVQCSKCGREFRDNILLKRHIKYAHGGTYSCFKCSAKFSSEPALSTHMKSHKLVSERKYKCSFQGCTKKFNFPHHLKHHELTHTDAKQYYCKICNKGFIQSHHFKTHMKTHTADVSLNCTFPDCTKRFATEYAKKRHMAKHRMKTENEILFDSNSLTDLSSCMMKEEPSNGMKTENEVSSEFNTPPDLSSCMVKEEPTNAKKSDSGISSEPNSAHDLELSNDAIICSSCGLMVIKSQYEQHTISCLTKEKGDNVTSDLLAVNTEYSEINDNFADTLNKNLIDEVSNCKLALGGCIMTEKDGQCVCAQISKIIGEDCDTSTSTESNPIVNICDTFTSTKSNPIVSISETDSDTRNFCESCECSEVCNKNKNATPDINPVIEYKTDGTVKIINTFDLDLPTVEYVKDIKSPKNDVKFIPYYSCKAVLGNCIVSGNGMMGDGCLCARMSLDDQVTAQEIDDITPCPKNEIFCK